MNHFNQLVSVFLLFINSYYSYKCTFNMATPGLRGRNKEGKGEKTGEKLRSVSIYKLAFTDR